MLSTCPFSLLPPPSINTPNPPPKSQQLTDTKSKPKEKKMGWFQLFLVSLLLCYTLAGGYEYEHHEGEGGEIVWGQDGFLLRDSVPVVETDAGFMRVVKGYGTGFKPSPMHIGFITMEPNSLFIPQYLDSSLILFVRSGNARVGHIHKDELAENKLKSGDIYRIEAGSAFYIANDVEDQQLQIICSIDTSESLKLGWQGFLSFFVGGGAYPTSVLSGFDPETLSVAFNVSMEELKEIMTTQRSGPIVFLSNSTETETPEPSVWSRFLHLEKNQRLAHLKRVFPQQEEKVEEEEEEEEDEEEDRPTWYLRKLMISVFGNEENTGMLGRKKGKGSEPSSYNIFDRKADFNNDYGWSKAVDEADYKPLRHSGLGVYLVNLTAGSMMAPHVNPRATEYGVVLKGTGTIQIVYPNGTLAMNAKVTEGDVFWIPRYFPFCQIASRTGPFEFFGYTTSSRKNRPQFLVGANSLLHTLEGPEIAAAFGVDEDRYKKIIDAQREGVILPSAAVAPHEKVAEKKMMKRMPELIRSFGSDLVM